jgi:thiol:disulfide interchange protein
MMKNTVRGILGLVLTAAATWLANKIVDQVFGPDEETA